MEPWKIGLVAGIVIVAVAIIIGVTVGLVVHSKKSTKSQIRDSITQQTKEITKALLSHENNGLTQNVSTKVINGLDDLKSDLTWTFRGTIDNDYAGLPSKGQASFGEHLQWSPHLHTLFVGGTVDKQNPIVSTFVFDTDATALDTTITVTPYSASQQTPFIAPKTTASHAFHALLDLQEFVAYDHANNQWPSHGQNNPDEVRTFRTKLPYRFWDRSPETLKNIPHSDFELTHVVGDIHPSKVRLVLVMPQFHKVACFTEHNNDEKSLFSVVLPIREDSSDTLNSLGPRSVQLTEQGIWVETLPDVTIENDTKTEVDPYNFLDGIPPTFKQVPATTTDGQIATDDDGKTITKTVAEKRTVTSGLSFIYFSYYTLWTDIGNIHAPTGAEWVSYSGSTNPDLPINNPTAEDQKNLETKGEFQFVSVYETPEKIIKWQAWMGDPQPDVTVGLGPDAKHYYVYPDARLLVVTRTGIHLLSNFELYSHSFRHTETIKHPLQVSDVTWTNDGRWLGVMETSANLRMYKLEPGDTTLKAGDIDLTQPPKYKESTGNNQIFPRAVEGIKDGVYPVGGQGSVVMGYRAPSTDNVFLAMTQPAGGPTGQKYGSVLYFSGVLT